MLPLAFNILLLAVFGIVASIIANQKGRNPVGWFFGGFFLGLVGVVVVAVLPNLKTQREKEARLERQNRRLQERLRQEQVKGESFRRHTTARLDVHDDTLGLDTRSFDTLPESAQPPRQLAADNDDLASLAAASSDQRGSRSSLNAAPPPPPPPNGPAWYYEREGEVYGPLHESRLADLFAANRLDGSTLVWNENLDEWTEARAVSRLQPHLPGS